MDAYEIFRMMAASLICKCYDCTDCQKILRRRSCPFDNTHYVASREQIKEFVLRMDKAIQNRADEETFDWQLSEDELVDIILGTVNDK